MTEVHVELGKAFGRAVDVALDRSIIGGFSSVGYAIRRRLGNWPADPPAGALVGRVALVTGASSGLGAETAVGLARLGAQVHLVVRDRAKGERVVRELRAEVGADADVLVWQCDLADLDAVRELAAQLRAELDRLDVLVHNAGVLPPERTESAHGHELSMAVHVLAPVLLTDELAPLLRDSEHPGRIILITSGGMYAQRLRADDPEYRDGDYSGTAAYARSKRAQVVLLPVLARRWAPALVLAMHPGWADTPGVSESLPGFRKLTRPILRDAAAGADTTIWLAALQPAPPSGGLWHDRAERPRSMVPWTRTSNGERTQLWRWVRSQLDLGEPRG